MPGVCDPLIGVVPVFINAGAALLPAIIAALASVLSLLVRPRSLFRAIRARPKITATVALSMVVVVSGAGFAMHRPAAGGPRNKTAGSTLPDSPLGLPPIDWAAIAMQWIREERLAGAAPIPVLPSSAADARAIAGGKTPIMLGGGPLRNGYDGGTAPLGLQAAWEFPSPGSPGAEDLEGAMFLASPAVMGDAVYAGSCLLDAFGNYGTLVCLDAATGKPRWTASTYRDASGDERQLKGIFSSPAISADGDYLVVGQGLHSDDHCDLVCFDGRTGRFRWRVKTPLHIESSPAIGGDLAVVGAGSIEEGSDHRVKGHPGLVVAVKTSTGEKLWEQPINDPESSPAIVDGIVYIGSGFNGSEVVALRTEKDEVLERMGLSRVLWRTPTPHPATGAVTVTDDLVLIGCGNGDYVFASPEPDGAVLALERENGRVLWEIKTPDAVLGRIAVHGSRAIVPVRNGEVIAINLGSSAGDRVQWRQRINGAKPILAGPSFTGSLVYAVSQDGYLAVLDAANGEVLERHTINAKGKPGESGLCVSSPTVALGRVFVGSETGGLRCFVGAAGRGK